VPTWKLTVEYEGTRYHGWQEQKNARTVAGVIRQSAEEILGKPLGIGGSGRTDGGVHALAQVAHLRAKGSVQPLELLRRLNSGLPADINVIKVEPAAETFDARRDATSRFYLYQISQRRTAFAKPFVWWVKSGLDLEVMRSAAEGLIGQHDFAAFCDKRADDRSTTVTVERVEMCVAGDLILFRIGASHFLWRMVRRIVGMLVEVGSGSVSPRDFASLLSPAGPTARAKGEVRIVNKAYVAAHTAPSSGLFLERVMYSKKEAIGPLVPAFPVSST
jgi:tRNA pseudouridine38-40 synthase